MRIVTKSEVRKMTQRERLMHYEQEKQELFNEMKQIHGKEIRDAHEALRKKWMV